MTIINATPRFYDIGGKVVNILKFLKITHKKFLVACLGFIAKECHFI